MVVCERHLFEVASDFRSSEGRNCFRHDDAEEARAVVVSVCWNRRCRLMSFGVGGWILWELVLLGVNLWKENGSVSGLWLCESDMHNE